MDWTEPWKPWKNEGLWCFFLSNMMDIHGDLNHQNDELNTWGWLTITHDGDLCQNNHLRWRQNAYLTIEDGDIGEYRDILWSSDTQIAMLMDNDNWSFDLGFIISRQIHVEGMVYLSKTSHFDVHIQPYLYALGLILNLRHERFHQQKWEFNHIQPA